MRDAGRRGDRSGPDRVRVRYAGQHRVGCGRSPEPPERGSHRYEHGSPRSGGAAHRERPDPLCELGIQAQHPPCGDIPVGQGRTGRLDASRRTRFRARLAQLAPGSRHPRHHSAGEGLHGHADRRLRLASRSGHRRFGGGGDGSGKRAQHGGAGDRAPPGRRPSRDSDVEVSLRAAGVALRRRGWGRQPRRPRRAEGRPPQRPQGPPSADGRPARDVHRRPVAGLAQRRRLSQRQSGAEVVGHVDGHVGRGPLLHGVGCLRGLLGRQCGHDGSAQRLEHRDLIVG